MGTEDEILHLKDDCFHDASTPNVSNTNFSVRGHGVVSYIRKLHQVNAVSYNTLVCRFHLRSPYGTVLSLHWQCTCENGLYVNVVQWDLTVELQDWPPDDCTHDPGVLLVTKANILSGTLRLDSEAQVLKNITFMIQFKVIPQSEIDHLTRYTSATSGTMTSLGFQRCLSYPSYYRSWGKIVVPPGRGLMISVPKLHLASYPIDCLNVFITDLLGDVTHVQKECAINIVPANVYSSVRLAAVEMTSNENLLGTGFKLLFSIHELGRLPQKLSSGLFNCSMDDYSSFRQHLHCNLDHECAEGQDETGDCPYSSDQCRGQLASGNKCFFLVGMNRLRHNTSSWAADNKRRVDVFDDKPLSRDLAVNNYIKSSYQTASWYEVARECEQGNGRLAAFTTEQQWHDVLRLLTYSKVSLTQVSIGYKMLWKKESFMYRYVLKSYDGTLVYFMPQLKREVLLSTAKLSMCALGYVKLSHEELTITMDTCDMDASPLGLCERTVTVHDSNSPSVLMSHQSNFSQYTSSFHGLTWNETTAADSLCKNRSNYTLVLCPCGHVTHSFLSCDLYSSCGGERHMDECPILSSGRCESRLRQWSAQYQQYTAARDSVQLNTSGDLPLSVHPCTDYVDDGRDHGTRASVAMFVCANRDTVHYSLVCDFRPDCLDSSDESFCLHLPCDGFRCSNGQCVPKVNHCDGKVQCQDESDEFHFACERYQDYAPLHTFNWYNVPSYFTLPRQAPGLIDLDGTGYFVASDWNQSRPCPGTHYRCASPPRYCLPIYTRCNGYYDCAGREDEQDCDDIRCPGLYRCRGSRVCVHVQHLCDGWPQCPQHDDEWRCQVIPCPASCLCQGLAFVCRGPFSLSDHPDLRYLSMDSTPVTPSSFNHHVYLIYLGLVRCELSTLPLGVSLPNLQVLDVSSNNITVLNTTLFEELPQVKVLKLAHNPVLYLVNGENEIGRSLQVLDLSYTLLEMFHTENLSMLFHIKQLNLSHSKVDTIGEVGFHLSSELEVLDMRGCPLKRFRLNMFRGLQSLSVVFSPNYRLCCDEVLPEQVIKPICLAPADHLSNCGNMLQVRSYQVALFVISFVATVGSVVYLISHYARHREPCLSGCELLVSNVNVASLLMGLYAGVIAVADELYRGRYVLHEHDWTESVRCQTACFMHVLSHQVSVLTVLVISLDRLAVLCFPNGRHRLSAVSAASVCFVTWCVGIVLAAVQSTSAWPGPKHSALCVPLPAFTARFAGADFHFGAVILQTVVVSSLIAVCQAFIFYRLKQRNDVCLSRTIDEVILAARINPVALVNAVCWLVVSVYSLVSKMNATSAESQLNVVLAVLVFPFPAAFSPLTLMYRRIQEDKRKETEAKLLDMLRSRALQQKEHLPHDRK